MTSLRRAVYLILAAVCFACGLVGVALPGVPTTPFLLLTSYFLVRSWPRLNDHLLQSRLFGPILRDWQQHRGVRPRVKLQTLVLVVVLLSVSIFATDASWGVRAGVLMLGCVGVAVVLSLPTLREG